MTPEDPLEEPAVESAEAEKERRRRLIKLIIGGLVTAWLIVLSSFLLAESRFSWLVVVLLIIAFAVFAIYILMDWKLSCEPRRKRSANLTMKPAVYYVSEHTPSSFSYVRERKPEPAENENPSDIPDFAGKEVYQAHWALFVKRVWLAALLLVILAAVALLGSMQRWQVFEIQGVKIWLLIAMVPLVLRVVYGFIDWVNDYYVINDDSVVDVNRRPFSRKEMILIPMGKIESVQFRKEGLMQLMLNYGTLRIQAGESSMDFEYVANPEKLQRDLLEKVEAYNRRQRQTEEEKQQLFIDNLVTALRQNARELD